MSWRNSLGKGKYKTSARKRNFKVPKILLTILLLSGVLFVLFYFSLIPFPFRNGAELESLIFKKTNQETPSAALVGAESVNLSIVEIVEKVSNSVVEIAVETIIESGAGSGVIISSDGYIVTNEHVISEAKRILVRLSNGNVYEAILIGTDVGSDLAVIKIDESSLLPAVIGSSGLLKTGESVVAIGNPLGTFGGTVTDGIISALEREVILDGVTMTVLQTNAAVNPGNSGGGLFNTSGELIGIIVAKTVDAEGIGFAIPIDIANVIISEIIKNSQNDD